MEVQWSNKPFEKLCDEKEAPEASFLLRAIRTNKEFERALYELAIKEEWRKKKHKVNVVLHREFLLRRYSVSIRIDAWQGYYQTHKVHHPPRHTLFDDIRILPIVFKYKKDLSLCQTPPIPRTKR